MVVYGLRPETDYELELVSVTKSGREIVEVIPWTSGTTPTLVQPLPVDAVDPEQTQPGWTLMNLMDPNEDAVVALFDLEGFPVWYHEMPGSGGVIDASWTRRGTVLLGGTLPKGRKPVELTLSGEVLWEGETQGGEHKTGTQHHHLERLRSGNLLSLEHDVRDEISGDLVIERTPAGDEVWSWNTFDHLEPKTDRFDWTHANWADTNGDRGWVSLATLGQVVQFDTKTGDIDWILGRNGTLALVGDTRWFDFQHAPLRLEDDHLLVYDNQGPAEGSRIVEYAIDADAGTAERVWQYDGLPDNPWNADFMGSVEVLENGNLLIAAGGDKDDRRVFEITAQGDRVWEMSGPKHYRARRIPLPLEVVE